MSSYCAGSFVVFIVYSTVSPNMKYALLLKDWAGGSAKLESSRDFKQVFFGSDLLYVDQDLHCPRV